MAEDGGQVRCKKEACFPLAARGTWGEPAKLTAIRPAGPAFFSALDNRILRDFDKEHVIHRKAAAKQGTAGQEDWLTLRPDSATYNVNTFLGPVGACSLYKHQSKSH